MVYSPAIVVNEHPNIKTRSTENILNINLSLVYCKCLLVRL